MEERTVFQPSAAGSVRPGTRLNGVYEIEKLIAEGGMGEVYRGFNIQTHDIVAIKMIRPEFMNNPEVFELFRREASILHNLTHEAIVRYFVFSVDPDIRRAYLAMEFVDGPSLTSGSVPGRCRSPRSGSCNVGSRTRSKRRIGWGSSIGTYRRTTSSCRTATSARPRSSISASPALCAWARKRSSAADSPANTTTSRPSSSAWAAERSRSSRISTASGSCSPRRRAAARST